jgi:ribosomal protein S18 acetylase RimI-like enzyme
VNAKLELEPELEPALRFWSALGEADVEPATLLLEHEYWNRGVSRECLRRALLGSAAWVGATLGRELIGTARAVSDGAKFAYIADVAVHRDHRGKGIGTQLVQLLLEHEAVRDVRVIRLGTVDAAGLYRKFGFVEAGSIARAHDVIEMALVRER